MPTRAPRLIAIRMMTRYRLAAVARGLFEAEGPCHRPAKTVKDLCLTENLAGSHVTLMDIDEAKLETIYRLAERYVKELGGTITFAQGLNNFINATTASINYFIQTEINWFLSFLPPLPPLPPFFP